jgi:predicted nucleic acid-binding protein
MPVEVAHALRRLEALGRIPSKTAAAALEAALTLDIELWPFAPFAERVWELRGAVTAYDAWYVALAETLEIPLATLDRRLAVASGPRCEFVIPD